MNKNQKGLWTVLIIILAILIIWGIVAAYEHSTIVPNSGDNGSASTSVQKSNGGSTNGGGTSHETSVNVNEPVITSINPSNGRAGILVTITGERFTASNNQVTFGGMHIANLGSNDTYHLIFTVPISVKTGAYKVGVNNANGPSNQGVFVVSSTSSIQ